MKDLIMRFRIETATRMFNTGIFDKSAFKYEVDLAVEWYAKGVMDRLTPSTHRKE